LREDFAAWGQRDVAGERICSVFLDGWDPASVANDEAVLLWILRVATGTRRRLDRDANAFVYPRRL
jgi:hypothetical protein